MLCVSHNGKISDPILTGLGGCFEMLKNFGFNISGSFVLQPNHPLCNNIDVCAGISPVSMMSSVRTAAMALMSQRSPPKPQSCGGVFAVGIVKRACVDLQAVLRRKNVIAMRHAPNHTSAIAGRMEALKRRAAAADGATASHVELPLAFQTEKLLQLQSTRDMHLSKAPNAETSEESPSVVSAEQQQQQQQQQHGELQMSDASQEIRQQEQLQRKLLAHQQVCSSLTCCFA